VLNQDLDVHELQPLLVGEGGCKLSNFFSDFQIGLRDRCGH